MLSRKEQSLLDALLPYAEREGIEIVTLEITGAKKAPTIRVYIDTVHGVGFDELAHAQSWINDLMDQIDPFPGAYTLEVSSPGIDRPLRTVDHFKTYLEEEAVIKTNGPVEGRSNFTGILKNATEDAIQIECDDKDYDIPFEAIKRAHLKGKINF